MDVYYHVKSQFCITSGSKVSQGVQICNSQEEDVVRPPPRNRVNPT